MKKLASLFIIVYSLCCNRSLAQQNPIVLSGGTIIDVTNYGNSENDIINAMVVFQKGKILYAGKINKTKIPSGAKIIDVKGKYIVPGLIDCFSALGSQTQANAHLYMGVTTIRGGLPGDVNRGEIFLQANPSPRIKRMFGLANWGEDTVTPFLTKEHIAKVSHEIDMLDSVKQEGFSSIFLAHRFPGDLFDKLIAKAKELDMAIIGETQHASYREAMYKGVNSFVHTYRYSLEAVPASIRDSVIHFPQLNSPDSKRWDWYFDTAARRKDKALSSYAKEIAASNTALIPTLAMVYAMLKDHENLWNEPAAKILDSSEILFPMDKQTGRLPDDSSWWQGGASDTAIAAIFTKAGCHFLTGSSTDAYGTMPGIFEHNEIKMLHQSGLTNRQALAAATNNFSIFFNWTDRGLIEAERLADILVLDANPVADLDNLKKIDLLFLNGVQLNRAMLIKK